MAVSPKFEWEEHWLSPGLYQASGPTGEYSLLRGMKSFGYEKNYELLILDGVSDPIRFETIGEVRKWLKENNYA